MCLQFKHMYILSITITLTMRSLQLPATYYRNYDSSLSQALLEYSRLIFFFGNNINFVRIYFQLGTWMCSNIIIAHFIWSSTPRSHCDCVNCGNIILSMWENLRWLKYWEVLYSSYNPPIVYVSVNRTVIMWCTLFPYNRECVKNTVRARSCM